MILRNPNTSLHTHNKHSLQNLQKTIQQTLDLVVAGVMRQSLMGGGFGRFAGGKRKCKQQRGPPVDLATSLNAATGARPLDA